MFCAVRTGFQYFARFRTIWNISHGSGWHDNISHGSCVYLSCSSGSCPCAIMSAAIRPRIYPFTFSMSDRYSIIFGRVVLFSVKLICIIVFARYLAMDALFPGGIAIVYHSLSASLSYSIILHRIESTPGCQSSPYSASVRFPLVKFRS